MKKNNKVLSDDEFWSLVDQYDNKVSTALHLIIDAYKKHKSHDINQAIADYKLLRKSSKISAFAAHKIVDELFTKEINK